MAGESALLRSDSLAWLLGSLCEVNRVPCDAALVLQQLPPPYTLGSLNEAGAMFGFRFGETSFEGLAWADVSLPAVAFLRASPEDAEPELRPVLVVRADRDQLLYFKPGAREPQSVLLTEFKTLFEANLLLVSRDVPERPAADEEPADASRFGFRWFFAELLKHKDVWREVIAASLAIQLVGLATPIFTQVVIDKVVVHQTKSTLIVIAVGLVLFMLFNAGMTWLRQYVILHTGNRVDAVLGSQVFWHLLRLPMPYFENRATGIVVARLHAVETIREFLAGASVSLLLDLPFLCVFLAVMFWYSWQLSLIALLMLGLIVAVSVLVTPVLRTRLNRQFMLGARNQAFLTEYVSSMETVKTQQMEPHLRGRYDDLLANYLAAGFSTRQISNTYNVIANGLEQAMTLAILCAGALLVMENKGFTIGMLVAFQMFAGRLSQPMLRLAGLWQEFQQASIAVRRLGDVMNVAPEPHTAQPSRARETVGLVKVENVGFRYAEDRPFLYRNLTLTLGLGKLTVLAGPSGTGKSTLAKLLFGFYPPTEGRILIDGHDLRYLSANELRQYFGVVPQEITLFSGTLYENLVGASPTAGFDDAVQACRIAEIHDDIEKLPQGYNTVIGEHGVGLSGGQRQRLAIARAVLRRPKILVFDEATSNLDAPTAERFAQTVNRLKGKVTILFIAHHIPRGLAVDEVISLGGEKPPTQMRVVEEPA